MTETEIPVETRPYRRRGLRPKNTATPQRRAPVNGVSLTQKIELRIAEAIQERAEAMTNVCKLAYNQERVRQLTGEINELMQSQQRMIGQTIPYMPIANPQPSLVPDMSVGAVPFSHTAPIPPGVGSIPAKQPAVSGANVARDIAADPDFA